MFCWRKIRLRMLALALPCLALLKPAPVHAECHAWNCNMQMINKQTNPNYKQENDDGCKKVGANGKMKATSCYRTAAEQRAACQKICGNGGGCPGKCAPPGRSNHQHNATADIGGIPGSVEAGCKYLFDRCQTLRSANPSMGCEIGGYGPGAHHFAFGPIKNTAYNKCSFLKSQMGQDPSAWKKKQEEADNLEKQVMGGSPESPASPGSPAPASPSSPSGPTEEYPRDNRNIAGRSSPIPDGRSKGGSKKISKPGDPKDGENSKRVDEIGPGGEHDYSDITKSGGGTLPGGAWGGGSEGQDGPRSFGKNSGRGGAPDGFSNTRGSGGGLGGSSGSAESGFVTQEVTGKKSNTNEVLSSFSGNSKGGLGGSKLSVSGSEVDSAVKNLAKDFAPNLERNPASHTGADGANGANAAQDGISNAESDDLFTRCHNAHVRCAKASCVRFE